VVQKESNEWIKQHGPVTTGRVAIITSAGDLPAKFVVG
jgi:O-acetyl-ADP-ribose deacetylase